MCPISNGFTGQLNFALLCTILPLILSLHGWRLRLYIYSADIKKLRKQTKNPFVYNTINIWYEAWKFLGEKHSLSGLIHI